MSDAFARELQRYVDAARRLEGWELEFEPEPLAPDPPWDYEALARERAASAESLLDLGTGGGEVLSRILPARGRAFVTEWWHVNAPVAARRLGPRVPVVRASSLELPFRDRAFDLVLSRHEELSPGETLRVLAPGGWCLTQQMSSEHWPELRAAFPDMVEFPDHDSSYRQGFRDAGATVEAFHTYRRRVRFRDVGPLVYHLVAAPWMLPDFSLDTHRDALASLDRRAREDGGLVLTEGYSLLEVRAP